MEKGPRWDGVGTDEGAWAAWRLADMEPLDALHHLRAVIVAPHPDDEVLAAGGLMQRLAAAGAELIVVGVTDGEASHPRSPTVTPEALAARRAGERRQALSALGVVPTVIPVGLPDGEVSGQAPRLARCLEALLAHDSLCIAPWEGDGHPDHDAAGRTAAQVCAATGSPFLRCLIWTWHWATPGDERVPWGRGRRLDLTDAERDRKRRAVATFESQVAPLSDAAGDEVILTAAMLAHFDRPFEVFLQ
jgi:LmbE family N-acetylglucosaminyl deacetylase